MVNTGLDAEKGVEEIASGCGRLSFQYCADITGGKLPVGGDDDISCAVFGENIPVLPDYGLATRADKWIFVKIEVDAAVVVLVDYINKER